MSESTEIQPAEKSSEVSAFLEKKQAEIAKAAAGKMPVARIIQLATLCCYTNRELLKCPLGSILSSVVQAVSLGLDLHPSSGEAYLIPYWNEHAKCLECRFQAGYQGLIKLAMRTRLYAFIDAQIVYENDDFEWYYEKELVRIHRPAIRTPRGNPIGAYAVAYVLSSKTLTGVWLNIEDMDRIKACSKSATGKYPDKSPWNKHRDAMWRKSGVRQLYKFLDKTTEMTEAAASVDADYPYGQGPDDSPEGQPEPIPGNSKTEKLTAVIAKRAEALSTNGSTNGHKPPESTPEPPAIVAQVEPQTQTQPVAQAVITTPRTGYELEQVATVEGTLGWFQHFGAEKAFRAKVSQWSPNQVRTAWDAYQSEGL